MNIKIEAVNPIRYEARISVEDKIFGVTIQGPRPPTPEEVLAHFHSSPKTFWIDTEGAPEDFSI